MPLTAELIQHIVATVERQGLSEMTLQDLRGTWHDLHFTYCLDDDVHHPKPYSACRGFNLYLVDGREHCLKITDEPSHATGLVFAEVIDDD